MVHGDLLIVGDFNLHYEQDNAVGVSGLKDLLAENNLQQHVQQPTHRMGHTLDLVITRMSDSNITSMDVYPSTISDHHSVIFGVSATMPLPTRHVRQARDFRGMDRAGFTADLATKLGSIDRHQDVETLLEQYEQAVQSTTNVHAPMVSRVRQSRRREPWYNDEIHQARQLRHANEKRWRETKLEVHRQIFVQHRSQVNSMIAKAKREYYETALSTGGQKACFRVVNKLLHAPGKTLPHSSSTKKLCQDFASFFEDKISLIREKIQRQRETEGCDLDATTIPLTGVTLQQLEPTTEDELGKIIRQCTSKTCDLDSCPADLLKDTLDVHLPYLTAVVNGSFHQGLFPRTLRTALVRPLPKKEGLDTECSPIIALSLTFHSSARSWRRWQ